MKEYLFLRDGCCEIRDGWSGQSLTGLVVNRIFMTLTWSQEKNHAFPVSGHCLRQQTVHTQDGQIEETSMKQVLYLPKNLNILEI